MGGSDWRGWTGGVGLGGTDWRGRTRGDGLEGSDWGGRTRGVGLGESDWGVGLGGRTGSDRGLPCSQENKAFFLQKLHQNFTKFSKFFSAPSIPQRDVNIKMAFSNT